MPRSVVGPDPGQRGALPSIQAMASAVHRKSCRHPSTVYQRRPGRRCPRIACPRYHARIEQRVVVSSMHRLYDDLGAAESGQSPVAPPMAVADRVGVQPWAGTPTGQPSIT